MIKNTRKIRKATYLNEFKCIGGSCEDNCCIGWNVEIDKETFAKYQKIKDPELAEIIKETIYINEDSYDVNVDYAIVELKGNKHCPFLNDSRLCKMQARLGEDYLSNVCATYPRLSNEINGVLEYSATISCPEVARLILGCREGLRFVETEESKNSRKIISVSVETGKSEISVVKYLLELRDFTIRVLQARECPLWERILILGLFFQEVQEDKDLKQGRNIQKIINRFDEESRKGEFKDKIANLKKDEAKQVEILKRITDQLTNSKEIDSQEYLCLIQEFLSGIGATEEATVEQMQDNYNLSYNDFYLPFMQDKEYMLENYMVNYVFQSLFPAAESINPFEAYQKLVTRYGLIKYYLIGIGRCRNGLDERTVREFIQAFSKALEHNYLYFEKISDYMQKNNYNTMEYMSILVKN